MKIMQSLLVVILTGISQAASAHTGFHAVEGWLSGFFHPLMGPDHLLAMFGVGLWAVCITPDRSQLWRLPLVFMAVMMFGGVLGSRGMTVPGIEVGIAASVVLLGLLVTGMVHLRRTLAVTLIGLFALFHGYSHGAEMGQGTNPITYALGFVFATGLLHLAGIYFGHRLLPLASVYRASGAVMGGIGLYLFFHAV